MAAPLTSHFIALCDFVQGNSTIDYFSLDSNTVTTRANAQYAKDTASTSWPDGTTSNFKASTLDGGDGCGKYSYNGSLTEIAGLDNHGTTTGGFDNGTSTDVVPAYLDIATGQIHDYVKAVDHSGFTNKNGSNYYATTFDPTNETLWAIKTTGQSSSELDEFNNSGLVNSTKLPIASTDDLSSLNLEVLHGQLTPIVYTDNGSGMEQATDATPAPVTGQPLFLPKNILPSSNFAFGPIRGSDKGTAGAFLAQSTDQNSAGAFIYTVPAIGGNPTKLGTVAISTDVSAVPHIMPIRYVE